MTNKKLGGGHAIPQAGWSAAVKADSSRVRIIRLSERTARKVRAFLSEQAALGEGMRYSGQSGGEPLGVIVSRKGRNPREVPAGQHNGPIRGSIHTGAGIIETMGMREACLALGKSRQTLMTWIHDGVLPTCQAGGRKWHRIPVVAIEAIKRGRDAVEAYREELAK